MKFTINNKPISAIGAAIDAIMADQRVTAEELSEKSGVRADLIEKLVSGDLPGLPFRACCSMADALGISIKEIGCRQLVNYRHEDRNIVSLTQGLKLLGHSTNAKSNLKLHINGLGAAYAGLHELGLNYNSIDCYPEELRGFLFRDVKKTTLGEVELPAFVKPVHAKSSVDAGVYQDGELEESRCYQGDDFPVYQSEIVRFESEWRVFVLREEILWSACYKGNFRLSPDWDKVSEMVDAYKSAPVAYCMDVGIVEVPAVMVGEELVTIPQTRLVEVNDGICFGGYGLAPHLHAEMWLARWTELEESAPFLVCTSCDKDSKHVPESGQVCRKCGKMKAWEPLF